MEFTARDLSTLRVDDSGSTVVRYGCLPTPPARPGPVGTGPEGWLTSNVDGGSKRAVSHMQFSPLIALRRQWETPDAC